MSQSPLAKIRHLALDMDGTIYRGGTLFSFTVPVLARLDAMHIGYTFFTNNSSKSVQDYIDHLAKMGIGSSGGQFYTSTLSTISYIQRHHPQIRRVFLLGTGSMKREFEAHGFIFCDNNPEAVVVGFDPEMSFPGMCRAGYWIQKGLPFIATHPDKICPTDQPTLLIDCGSVCAALEAATGKFPAAVLGKPHPLMIEEVLHRHGLQPAELAVVGDRLYTDIAMAHAAGAVSVLVLTGESTREEAESSASPPTFIMDSLLDLADALAVEHRPAG